VCVDDVDDPGLRQLVSQAAVERSCSYCDRTADSPIAARLDVLIERIAEGLNDE
jgi:hypothetical protein